MKTRILPVILLLAISPSRLVRSQKFCAGDQARVRLLYEVVAVNAEQVLEEVKMRLLHFVPAATARIGLWTLWSFQFQAEQHLLQQLAPPGSGHLDELSGSLEPLWQKAKLVRSYLFPDIKTTSEMELEGILKETVAALSVCQAVQGTSRLPCERLARIDADLYLRCLDLLIDVGIIFSSHCDEESLELASEIRCLPFFIMNLWCQSLVPDGTVDCLELRPYPLEVTATCRAILSHEPGECDSPGLSPDGSSVCHVGYRSYHYIHAVKAEPLFGDTLHRMALRAARLATLDCIQATLQTFATWSAPEFLVPPGPP